MIKDFIVRAVVADYRANGATRQMLLDDGASVARRVIGSEL
jgi:hypothetical protein